MPPCPCRHLLTRAAPWRGPRTIRRPPDRHHLLPSPSSLLSSPNFPDRRSSSLSRASAVAAVLAELAAVDWDRPGQIAAHQLLRRVFLYLLHRSPLAGGLGIERIVLVRVRSLRHSPLSVPAESGRRGRPRPRHRVPGENRVPFASSRAPYPSPVAGVVRSPPVPRRHRAPGLGRPWGRLTRAVARPSARPGPATRPVVSGPPPAWPRSGPAVRPASSAAPPACKPAWADLWAGPSTV